MNLFSVLKTMQEKTKIMLVEYKILLRTTVKIKVKKRARFILLVHLPVCFSADFSVNACKWATSLRPFLLAA